MELNCRYSILRRKPSKRSHCYSKKVYSRLIIQDILEGDKKRMTAFIEGHAKSLRKESKTFLKEMMNQGARFKIYERSTKELVHDSRAKAGLSYNVSI